MKAIMSGIQFISIVFLIVFTLAVDIPAAEFTCVIKAGRQDVHVVVTDYDQDGNPMHTRGVKFQGVIKKGQKQTINSLYGKIRYSYRLYNQSRTNGGNRSNCKEGKTIQLP